MVLLTEPSHAVFLSYASQDAEAARRIADALRAGGVEVWFDTVTVTSLPTVLVCLGIVALVIACASSRTAAGRPRLGLPRHLISTQPEKGGVA